MQGAVGKVQSRAVHGQQPAAQHRWQQALAQARSRPSMELRTSFVQGQSLGEYVPMQQDGGEPWLTADRLSRRHKRSPRESPRASAALSKATRLDTPNSSQHARFEAARRAAEADVASPLAVVDVSRDGSSCFFDSLAVLITNQWPDQTMDGAAVRQGIHAFAMTHLHLPWYHRDGCDVTMRAALTEEQTGQRGSKAARRATVVETYLDGLLRQKTKGDGTVAVLAAAWLGAAIRIYEERDGRLESCMVRSAPPTGPMPYQPTPGRVFCIALDSTTTATNADAAGHYVALVSTAPPQVPALSLQEPFASLVCSGAKLYESRSGPLLAAMEGQSLAIRMGGLAWDEGKRGACLLPKARVPTQARPTYVVGTVVVGSTMTKQDAADQLKPPPTKGETRLDADVRAEEGRRRLELGVGLAWDHMGSHVT